MVYYKAKNTVLKISMKIKPKKKINFFNSAKKTFSKELEFWIKNSLKDEVMRTLDNKESYVKEELNFDIEIFIS